MKSSAFLITIFAVTAGVALFSAFSFPGPRQEKKKIEAGDPAPVFSGETHDGKTISLKDYRGKQNVVLYFYPKDDTPGCTKEACSFRDNIDVVRSTNTAVIGVSVDDVESHKKFAEKYELNFPLITDTERKITTLYGAGRNLGVTTIANRVTFLIDKEGVVRHVWPKVTVDGHTEELLAKIKELGLDK